MACDVPGLLQIVFGIPMAWIVTHYLAQRIPGVGTGFDLTFHKFIVTSQHHQTGFHFLSQGHQTCNHTLLKITQAFIHTSLAPRTSF